MNLAKILSEKLKHLLFSTCIYSTYLFPLQKERQCRQFSPTLAVRLRPAPRSAPRPSPPSAGKKTALPLNLTRIRYFLKVTCFLTFWRCLLVFCLPLSYLRYVHVHNKAEVPYQALLQFSDNLLGIRRSLLNVSTDWKVFSF